MTIDDLQYYQIAIIGGGLAGLSLAIQAADAGYSVVLFEKESYPFNKVCGEYISMESYPFLQRLGVQLDQLNVSKINRLQLSDMAGRLYEFNLPLGGFGISRYTLDNQLYHLALQKGVQVFTQTKVNTINFGNEQFNLTTSAGNFTTTVAAGAFGKRSNLDVKWKRSFVLQKPDKLNNYIGVKYHIRYPHPANTIALHNFKDGYCGMSAIEDGKSCLCYLTTAANLISNNNSVASMEDKVLQQNSQLHQIFSKAEFLYEEPLVISQVSFSEKTQVENSVLMLGDAAGMITPLCGNGMSMAMQGSKLAFEAIQSFLQNKTTRPQMETAYTKGWQQQFAQRLWMGRQVQKLFGGRHSTALFLKTMQALPFVSKRVIAATHGKPF